MLVLGDHEEEAGAVAVRSHEEGELGALPVAEFVARVRDESDAELDPCRAATVSILRKLDSRHEKHRAPLSAPCPSLPLARLTLHHTSR